MYHGGVELVREVSQVSERRRHTARELSTALSTDRQLLRGRLIGGMWDEGGTVPFKVVDGLKRRRDTARQVVTECEPVRQWDEGFKGCMKMVRRGNYRFCECVRCVAIPPEGSQPY